MRRPDYNALTEEQRSWTLLLMQQRPDLKFADVVRYCFEFAMELDPEAAVAARTAPGLRRG